MTSRINRRLISDNRIARSVPYSAFQAGHAGSIPVTRSTEFFEDPTITCIMSDRLLTNVDRCWLLIHARTVPDRAQTMPERSEVVMK
jgi:hypothetical protein